MSAFVVSHKHINTLLSYANRAQEWRRPRIKLNDGTALNLDQLGDLQHAAEILLSENYRSVYARYPDAAENEDLTPGVIAEIGCGILFSFEHVRDMPAVKIIKLCDCYHYQACETDDYQTTDAHRIVDAIRELAIDCLPGMSDAEWAI